MNEYLNKCKDLEVAYYSNKENDLDLKYNTTIVISWNSDLQEFIIKEEI